jgi:cell division protein FtsB
MKEFLRRYRLWVVSAGVLILLVCFFSDLNIFEYFATRRRVYRLQREIERYEEKITEDSLFMQRLRRDDEFLEKYAREKHLMHAEDEQLFIVE